MRLILAMLTLPAVFGQVNVLTWHNDAARTGQNLQETILTPANVNMTGFGKLFTITVDGKVDAQPLYVAALSMPNQGVRNVLYVATEHDSAYAFDADTGVQLWHVSLLGAGESTSDDRNCGQVTPEIGITSTPAIDLQTGPHGTMYAIAMSKDGSGGYHQRLHALDLTTGAEQSGGPVEVHATYPGAGDGSVNGTLTFDPKQYKERAALLLSNGVVYTSWASHCDIFPYTAWVIGYNANNLAQVSVLNLTPNGSDGSVWAAGAGPALDSGGNLYFLIANGTFDTTLDANGFPNKGDYGNAFVKLSTSGPSPAVADYFTMSNTVAESNADEDLGSGGAMVLPLLNDAQGNPRALAVGAGKDGNIYVVDRNNMGKFNAATNAIYQELPGALGSVFSSPAWFNGKLYYGAVGDTLKAFNFTNGSFGAAPASHSAIAFGYPGTTPSISANGSSNGIVWAAENSALATLHAYDAANLATELYNSNQAANGRDHFGDGNKFITPTVANGKVYVGTTNGVGVFGPLNCTYTVNTHSAAFTAAASSGMVNVTTSAGCLWSVANSSGFISVSGGASGSGSGTVSYSIPANPGFGRSGVLTIGGQTFTLTQAGGTTTAGLGFYPLTPCRVADTRSFGGKLGALGPPFMTRGSSRDFPVPAGSCNIPAGAQAYSLNVSVVPHGPLGFLSLWPAGAPFPDVSTLNSFDGSVIANAAIVPAGSNGAVRVYASDDTDVFIDINGYFAPPTSQALAFYPLTPCRVADTRSYGGKTGPLGPPSMNAFETRSFPLPSGSCGIPGSAQAYSLNISAWPTGPLQYLSTWADGQPRPFVSTLNAYSGGLVANAAIVPAGAAGAIDVFVTDRSDVFIDVNGYFAPPGNPGALYFYPLTPCRAADTRSYGGKTGAFGPPRMTASSSRDFPLPSGSCAVPASAQAYSLNVSVWPSGPLGYLSAWPAGQVRPFVSTLNSLAAKVVANAALVPAGASGAISIYVTDATDVFIDINGYFAP